MNGMSLLVKQVSKLVIGFILLYSIYLILYGHLSPGGGFVGGVTLGCCFILMVLAFGKEFTNTIISDRATTIYDSVGALGFLLIALTGYFAGDFLINFIPTTAGQEFKLFSSGTILLANIAIGLKVGACLAGVFGALIVFVGKDQQGQGGAQLL